MELFEIVASENGATVWVNGDDGSCIGRFSKVFGIDVHTTATAQMDGASECIFCTKTPGGPQDWAKFREKVLEAYGIDVPEDTISFEDSPSLGKARKASARL